MQISQNSHFEISRNIVFRKESTDSYLMLEIEGDLIIRLEAISSDIWTLISENKSYQEILEFLEETYEPFGKEEIHSVEEFIMNLIEHKVLILIS